VSTRLIHAVRKGQARGWLSESVVQTRMSQSVTSNRETQRRMQHTFIARGGAATAREQEERPAVRYTDPTAARGAYAPPSAPRAAAIPAPGSPAPPVATPPPFAAEARHCSSFSTRLCHAPFISATPPSGAYNIQNELRFHVPRVVAVSPRLEEGETCQPPARR